MGPLLLGVGTVGCSPEIDLFVDLRTDYEPGQEIARIEVGFWQEGSGVETALPDRSIAMPARAMLDYRSGERIADLEGLTAGDALIRVRLVAPDGGTLAVRDVRIALRETTGVTVLVTRNCGGVVCGAGDACVNGTCVSDACTPENPAACADALCSADSECAATSECAPAQCVLSACLATPDPGLCGAEELCDPDSGCYTPGDDPFTLPPTPIETVGLGAQHSCSVLSDEVLCWGANTSGRLGDGTQIDRYEPAPMIGLAGVPVATSGGGGHSCVLLADGRVQCVGEQQGIGQGFVTMALTPLTVPIPTATQVSSGYVHACALIDDGRVFCWGNDYYGAVGNGPEPSLLEPIQVAGLSDAVALSVNGWHSCALRSDGTAACWGWNEDGQLGDGTLDNRDAPVDVAGLDRIVQLEAGVFHTCAIRDDASAWCWGRNSTGEVGDFQGAPVHMVPFRIPGLDQVMDIATGELHTCAVDATGTVTCWGHARQGRLGYESGDVAAPPTAVAGLPTMIELDAGGGHTCARSADDSFFCWGVNDSGQVGSPEPIVNQPFQVGMPL